MTRMIGRRYSKRPSVVGMTLSPRVAIPLAVALFAAVSVARFADSDPNDAISVLYVLPVGLVAASLGAVPGVIAGVAGMALLGSWAAMVHPQLHLLGWLSRAMALLPLGGLLGSTADRLRRSQGRFSATLESMLDPFVVLEPVVDLAGRLVDVQPVYANAAARAGGDATRLPLLRGGGDASATVMAGLRRTFETHEPFVLDGLETPAKRSGGGSRPRTYDVRAFWADDMLACTWRDVTDRTELQTALSARREAGDINDSIVQRLAVAKWMLESGKTAKGLVMVGETMEVAQRLVTELLDGDVSSGLLIPPAAPASQN